MIKELVSYEINSKPTVILIEGTENSGFLYKIKWYDSIFARELECANMKFSGSIKEAVIQLAKAADTNNG